MDGILLIDKPAGWTSHDVVAKVRSVLRQATSNKQQVTSKLKVGHTGTLDPFASGLLVLVLGSYTKRAGEFSKLDKVYEAELNLGATSSTGDPEGELTQYKVGRIKYKVKPSKEEVEAVLAKFVGEIKQIPPVYSAVKVGGQRAYKLARQGKEVKLEPRKVKIYEITDVKYNYPKLKFACKVSSGTYIRSLAQDIGNKLGTGAYLSALRRTQIGRFVLSDALELEELAPDNLKNSLQTEVESAKIKSNA